MEPPSPYSISILNESGIRVSLRGIRRALRATLSRHSVPPGTVSVLFTNDERQRELNRTFRGVDDSTDVLTFPAVKQPRSSRRTLELGDVSISIPYAQRQAGERGASLDTEVAYLAVHAGLHLAGFDDVEPVDRRRMQIAMSEMGAFLGLEPDPAWSSLLHAVVEEPV
jgi:probable rRNA maturation factor